jgi:RNA polymerase sigma-70 factor, ECF subfamily
MQDDIELAQRVAAGDEDAFGVLMRRHNRMLYRAARSILHAEGEVEDAVQEAYLRAYRTIGQFRGEAKLSTWLVRIVLNEAIGRSRRLRRGTTLALRLDDEPDSGAVSEPPELGAQHAQIRRMLQAKIDALPDALRSVFVLRALEELSVEEVAAALDIPKTVVRMRFFRARRMLQASLSADIELPLSRLFPFAGRRCDAMVRAVLARVVAATLPSVTH